MVADLKSNTLNTLNIHPNQGHPRDQLRLPRSFQLTFFLILLSTGFIAFSRRHFAEIIQSEQMSRAQCMITDISGSISSAITLSIVAYLSYYYPLWRRPRLKTYAQYLLGSLVHILLFVWLSMTLRNSGFKFFALEHPGPHELLALVQAEFPAQLFMLTVTIATVHGLYFFQTSTVEQLRLTQIEEKLAQERLKSLQSQLNPHFLFNTLNMISGMMYQDVAIADRMIERLSDLLRASLMFGARAEAEVTIAEEIELLSAYTSIMQERFPDQFTVDIDCPRELYQTKIPPLLLQPLVENSIKHGSFDTRRTDDEVGLIQVKIRSSDHHLEIKVIDNGQSAGDVLSKSLSPVSSSMSAPTRLNSSGVGLKLTRDRLRLLYRDQARFEAARRAESGGYQVEIILPYE